MLLKYLSNYPICKWCSATVCSVALHDAILSRATLSSIALGVATLKWSILSDVAFLKVGEILVAHF